MFKKIKSFSVIAPVIFLTSMMTMKTSAQKSIEWQPYFQNQSVAIQHKYAECYIPAKGIHHEYILLRISNLTDADVQLSFEKELWYNDKCATCYDYSQENHYVFFLKPNTVKEGSCEDDGNKSLKIFAKMLDFESESKLTKFDLKNIQSFRIYQSPEDNDLPMYIETGNKENDWKLYDDAKQKWIEKNPEKYKQLTEQEKTKIETITYEEFKKLPDEKQKNIKSHPDKYVIKEQ